MIGTKLDTLKKTAALLVASGKGILSADENPSSLANRFHSIDVENTAEQRRIYRQILFSTPNIHRYLSGVIMHEETFSQSNDSSITFPVMLTQIGILSGIKLDRVIIFDIELRDNLITIGIGIINDIDQ